MSIQVLLSVGFDADLLQLRAAVLQSAGYTVRTETNLAEAQRVFLAGDFDLIILCHSIPDDERWRFISDVRPLRFSIPILALTTQSAPEPSPELLASHDGPDALLRRVSDLLAPPKMMAQSAFASLRRRA